jgi:organic hydroperoxide reductase OsmC/OhrA
MSQELPHHYLVSADASSEGTVSVNSEGLQSLATTSPPQFGGPEGYWSPETLLIGAIANCYILTFRAVARASRFEWHSLSCTVNGVLDRVDRKTRFTEYHVKAILHLPPGSNEEKARKLLDKANTGCLITNSLNGTEYVDTKVIVTD